MNAQQYKRYQDSVAYHLKDLNAVSTGACLECEDCGLGLKTCPHCDGEKIDIEQEEGACPNCSGSGYIAPSLDEFTSANESSFSWHACEACGSTLGGDRHPAHGVDKDGAILHLSVCTDCLYYLNYGQLDDMAMMEIEQAN